MIRVRAIIYILHHDIRARVTRQVPENSVMALCVFYSEVRVGVMHFLVRILLYDE